VKIVAFVIVLVLFSSCKKDENNPATPPASGTLTLKLDPSLDGGGDIKVTSLTKGILVNTAGSTVKTATVSGGNLVFELSSVTAGDYFIIVNDSTRDRVPTRITDNAKDHIQPVGQKLRASRIIVGTDTLFRVKTYSQGQGEHAIRKYSDGNNVSPLSYAYVILSYKVNPRTLEIRTMENNSLLYAPSSASQGPHAFVDWIMGGTNHGKGPAGDTTATQTQCGSCHTNFNTKPAQWSQITGTNGYCFKCHYGQGGDPDGFLDPTK